MKLNNIFKYLILLIISIIFIPNVYAWELFVELPEERQITLDVESSDTITAIKSKIQDKEGYLPAKQIIFFDNNKLEDNKTIADYNIQRNDTIKVDIIKYTVTFDGNEGIFTEEKTSISIDNFETTSTLPTVTRYGYEFLGFYTEKTNGIKYEDYIKENNIDKDIIFYAQWKKIENIVMPPNTGVDQNLYLISIFAAAIVTLFQLSIIKKLKD